MESDKNVLNKLNNNIMPQADKMASGESKPVLNEFHSHDPDNNTVKAEFGTAITPGLDPLFRAQNHNLFMNPAQQQQIDFLKKHYQEMRFQAPSNDQGAQFNLAQNAAQGPNQLSEHAQGQNFFMPNSGQNPQLNNVRRSDSRSSSDRRQSPSFQSIFQPRMGVNQNMIPADKNEHMIASATAHSGGNGQPGFVNISPKTPGISNENNIFQPVALGGFQKIAVPMSAASIENQNPFMMNSGTPQVGNVVFQLKNDQINEMPPNLNVSSPQIGANLPVGNITANPLNTNNMGVIPQFIQPQSPNQTQQVNPQMDLLNIQSKMSVILNQMSQIQSNLLSINMNNPQHPQSVQIIQVLTNRWQLLKNVYQQLFMQQQQLQQRFMVPMQGGIPQQLLNNPNAIALLQQQLAMQQQGQFIQNPQLVGTVQRQGMMPNSFQLRQGPQMPGSSPMMMPNLARFPSNQRMPFMNTPQGMFPMHGQSRMVTPMSSVDSGKGRRGNRGSRRRRKYSTESEEEEEMSTSEVESSPPGTSIGGPMEEMELRRSTRRHVVKSYAHEFPDDSETDDKSKKDQDIVLGNGQDLVPFNPSEQVEGKIMLIEKILSDRNRLSEEADDPLNVIDGHVEEYFVKFKCFSYLHCEWCTVNDLRKRDRNALNKIKRYRIKKQESPFLYVDDDPFNQDYLEIDRVLEVKKTPDPSNPDAQVLCYLIKWCALPYDESTWEFEDVVDEVALVDFYERNKFPPAELLAYRQRPNVAQWHKIQTSPMYKNGNMLRDYQLEGINWLLYEYYAGTNCILADEMGLGKTIQSITFLIEVRRLGIRGPFLIIAPLSTIGNWYREFLNWSDFNVVVFHGTASSRNIIHRYELYYRNENGDVIPGALKFEVLITTYEMILAENNFLKGVNWRIAIVDEAHRLKNRNCKLLENLSFINIEHRVLLTGTPLQNTFDELLSLLNFLEPVRAKALEQIVKTSGKLESNVQVQQIQTFLKPVILRRLKEDVEKNIAPKEETIIEVEMTTIQKKVYRGVLERNLSFLTKGTSSTNLPNLMNIMMELRKCCNHPFLINGVEDKIIGEYISIHPELDRKSLYVRALVESSGKLVLVDKLLPKLRQNGHKMLIFSQMVRVLDLIEEYLVANNFIFERIDGSVRGNLRQAAIDRFSKPDSDRSVFLLCTKAGGLGINLTAADTVIIFDSDWNPQNDIQAQARCHRIGQNKAVKVYRLICRKTYEREMFDRASMKLGLDKAVLQDINSSSADAKSQINPRTQLTKKEVEELLRKGAYAAVMEEDTEASARFCAEDIDQILERRATVVQIAGAVKGSTFAKASFNAEVSSEQVDIDDPDFWQKWAKSAKVNPAVVNDFMDDKPRIRKQVQQLDTDPDVEYNNDLISDEENQRTVNKTVSQRNSWQRKECLKVEKFLLVFGWGRWADILKSACFKSFMSVRDVEQISKTILIIAWHVCKSDNTFNDFVDKAIRMTTLKHRQEDIDSEDYNYRPYGKRTRSKSQKSSKKKAEKIKMCLVQAASDWKNLDIDTLVLDPSYKKHLLHCSSKILIRLRLLFIIEYYILREAKEEVLLGVSVEDLDIKLPTVNQNGVTLPQWWDVNCDKSLIVGTFKHGYEQYSLLRTDKQLCFLRHIGLTDNKLSTDTNEVVIKRRGRKKKVVAPIASDDDDAIETSLLNEGAPEASEKTEKEDSNGNNNELPPRGECNTYLKRLVMGYWKNRVKLQQKSDENKKTDHSLKHKWTRKEESDFYKALVSFGLEHSHESNDIFIWNNFRSISCLEKKGDDMLSSYACSFIARCHTLINRFLEANQTAEIKPDPSTITDGFLTVEKADKAINRIELFDLLRTATNHPDFDIKVLSAPASIELPEWWNNEMDKDLLKGTSLYGFDQNDKRIFEDMNLGFHKIVQQFHQSFIASPELVTGVTDVNCTSDLSVEMIKAIIRWPKIKTIINRIYGLSMLITTDVWYDKYNKQLHYQIKNTLSPQQLENITEPPNSTPPHINEEQAYANAHSNINEDVEINQNEGDIQADEDGTVNEIS